jgi:Nif-specific regulatory protein
MMLYLSGARAEGTQILEQATANAEASRDSDILARVLFNIALCARHEDRLEDEDRILARTIELRKSLPRRERYIKAIAARTTVLSNRAHWQEFDILASEVEGLARESRNTHLLLQILAAKATASMLRGLVQQQAAIERVERALLGGVVHSEAWLHHLVHRAERLFREGREVAAARVAKRVVKKARADSLPAYEIHALLVLGMVAFRAGRLSQARKLFEGIARRSQVEPYLLHGAFSGLLRIARRGSNFQDLEELTAQVTGQRRHALWWDPLVEELEAVRFVCESRLVDAAAKYRAALELLSGFELRPQEMELAWEAGIAMADAGDRDLAVDFLRRGHAVAQGLGLEIQAGRIADLILDATASETSPDGDAASGTEEPDTLVRVANVLNSILDLPLLLEQSLELVCTRVAAERGFVLLTDGEGEGLRAVAQYGGADDSSRDKALEVSRTVVRQVTESGSPFRSDDASRDPRLGSTLSILDMSVRALLCTPLRLKDKVIGTIYVENRNAVTQFSDRDASLVDAFGNLVAVTIQNARLHDELRRSRDRVIGQNLSLRREVGARYSRPNIVGQSAEIERVLGEIERVALSRGSVLITGESGTGKELVAKTVHFASPRVDRPFLSLNCAALPADLIESELFGIEDHVATGVRGRPGIFERADGGTLFLDEIGDMPLSLQAKLLRVLQEREFSRLGGSKVVRVDIRLIAATNQDLRQLIRDGRFREDLYFRVHTLPIHIAPLRERKVDIPILASHFLHRFCEENGLPVPRISSAFTAAILGHSWPGNVRELQNYIERSVVMSRGPILEPVVLPTESDPGASIGTEAIPSLAAQSPATPLPDSLKQALEDTERRWILETLERFEGNQRKAARALGVVEPTLRYRMGRLGITSNPRPTGPKTRRSKAK